MCKLLAISNRTLCPGDYLTQLERIAAAKPSGIILREKELTSEAYEALAEQVLSLCQRYQVTCLLHTHLDVAQRLGCPSIHLPLSELRNQKSQLESFSIVGASVHSLSEAIEAEKLGATYLVAGHIFATNSKKGLAPRGLHFLHGICRAVRIPVYAIGGITPHNANKALHMGAKGVCIMSGLMNCASPTEYLHALQTRLER
jgi:thiamine-phosphate pyrophosphorylase